MNLHRIHAVILRHLYEFRHNLDRVTDTLFWPMLDIIMWGFLTVYMVRSANLQPGIINFFLGAIILWNLFRGFQRDMVVGFLAELWSRNLINLFSTPLSITEDLIALILLNLFKATIGLAAAATIACLCYAYDIFPLLPAFSPFMFNLILFALAISLVTTALILRFTTRVQGLAWSIVGALMPFSCVFYPLKALPQFMRPIAWCLPTTHSFEGMRELIVSAQFSFVHLAWCFGLNIFYLILALIFFNITFRSARYQGLLVKAE